MNLGKICYDGFRKSHTGILEWGALPKEIREHWKNAGEAVRDSLKKPKKELTEEEKAVIKEKRINDLKKKNEERKEYEQLKKESLQFKELKAHLGALSDDKEAFTLHFD